MTTDIDIQLTVREAAMQTAISDPLVVSQFHTAVVHKLGLSIYTTIYRYLTKEEPLARYPADWWQACKERWYPRWLLARYPVRYTQVNARVSYPHLAIPRLGKEYYTTVKEVTNDP